jgi:NAD(P)-dependent dehydrogenase (short-subunit alcohol dehydrogenase family)
MNPLEGRIALVTGCGRVNGLGRAIALALANAGSDLFVTDVESAGKRNSIEGEDAGAAIGWKGLESLVAEIDTIGRRAVASVGDVGNESDVRRMVDEAIDTFGRVDVLVNNAAAPHGLDRDWAWKVPHEAWDEVFRVNARGTFLMSGMVVRNMLERRSQGRIINIASTAGRHAYTRRSAYCASKFAVIGLTQSMALELAPHGITVNAVCPGAMATGRAASREARAELEEDFVPPPTPLVGRQGVPDDIGRAVAFLADPATDFVTGESLVVSGGDLMF